MPFFSYAQKLSKSQPAHYTDTHEVGVGLLSCKHLYILPTLTSYRVIREETGGLIQHEPSVLPAVHHVRPLGEWALHHPLLRLTSSHDPRSQGCTFSLVPQRTRTNTHTRAPVSVLIMR